MHLDTRRCGTILLRKTDVIDVAVDECNAWKLLSFMLSGHVWDRVGWREFKAWQRHRIRLPKAAT